MGGKTLGSAEVINHFTEKYKRRMQIPEVELYLSLNSYFPKKFKKLKTKAAAE